MILCKSIYEIGPLIQGHFQGKMSWSMSYKLTQTLCQTHIIIISKREENETFELICLESYVIPLFHMIPTESIYEIQSMIQGHL